MPRYKVEVTEKPRGTLEVESIAATPERAMTAAVRHLYGTQHRLGPPSDMYVHDHMRRSCSLLVRDGLEWRTSLHFVHITVTVLHT